MTVTVINTPEGIRLYRAIVIKHAIAFYLKTRKPVNTAYRPKAMRIAAGQILGKDFSSGQLRKAHDELAKWIEARKPETPEWKTGSTESQPTTSAPASSSKEDA